MEGIGINLGYLLLQLLGLLVILAILAGIVLLVVGLLRRGRPRPSPATGSVLIMEVEVTETGLLIPGGLLGDARRAEIRKRDDVLLVVPLPYERKTNPNEVTR